MQPRGAAEGGRVCEAHRGRPRAGDPAPVEQAEQVAEEAAAWLLLPEPPDWRWLRRRADSPWYPTLRLFRQPAPGDWAGAIAALCTALTARLGGT